MSTSQKTQTKASSLSPELKAEQALGLIGLGLMQKISKEGATGWNWPEEDDEKKADLLALRQRLEITALAIETGAPLTTSEVTQIMGAKPGSAKIERGGLVAKRISRNVWKLNRAEKEVAHWRN